MGYKHPDQLSKKCVNIVSQNTRGFNVNKEEELIDCWQKKKKKFMRDAYKKLGERERKAGKMEDLFSFTTGLRKSRVPEVLKVWQLFLDQKRGKHGKKLEVNKSLLVIVSLRHDCRRLTRKDAH